MVGKKRKEKKLHPWACCTRFAHASCNLEHQIMCTVHYALAEACRSAGGLDVAAIGYTHARRRNLETVLGYQICVNMATVYFAVIKMTDSLLYRAINYCVVFWSSHTWMPRVVFYCGSGT